MLLHLRRLEGRVAPGAPALLHHRGPATARDTAVLRGVVVVVLGVAAVYGGGGVDCWLLVVGSWLW